MSDIKNLKSYAKKITSVTLAALMLSGTPALMAKDYGDVKDEHEYREQIDILSDIGVIVGTSADKFSPEEKVTREQMAMFLFRLMLGRSNAGTTNSTGFGDLYDDTYHGAISWANASGYIIGTSEDTFEPTGGISLQDAMTMIVRALGQSNSNMDKGYPWTYIDAAVKLGLDRGLGDLNYEATLTRAQTAALLYNALTAEYLITKTSSNGQSIVTPTTIIEYVFGYELDDGVIIATNTHSIDGADLVIKTGYVTVEAEGGRLMTVNFDDLGLEGEPDEWLGRSVKLIYKTDAASKTVTVLGASYGGRSEKTDKATINDSGKTVTLGGIKYNIVESLSDSLSTNHNELLVYVYDDDGKLTQLKNNNELASYLGFCDITLIFDDSESDIADRAIVKNYSFDRLSIVNGEINIAGGLTAGKLTGGIANPDEAAHGDFVLYYFNKGSKYLEIVEVLEPQASGLVTKINGNKITIGDTEYTAGCVAAGVDPSAIKAMLSVGKYASVVVKDGKILAVNNSTAQITASTYLVVTGSAIPVYNNGALRYVTTAVIDGTVTSIMMTNSTVTEGAVYRYTVDGNGIYTLIDSSNTFFTQIGELKDIHRVNETTTLDKGSLPYYTLNGVNFVTDDKTVIVVKNGDKFEHKTGAYTSSIRIEKDAVVTAIYSDHVGNVEALRYLYISDGEMSSVDSSAQFVKVLSKTGSEYVNGIVYTSYEVFNHNTGKRETRLSLSDSLNIGTSYALDVSDRIAYDVTASGINGIVNGYTSSTVTVSGNIHKLAKDVKIYKINSDLSLTELTMSQINGTAVEFVIVGGEVKTILAGALTFGASYSESGKAVVITPSADISHIDISQIKVTSVLRDGTSLDLNGWDIAKDGASLKIGLYWITGGEYKIKFTVSGVEYSVNVTLPDITPAK